MNERFIEILMHGFVFDCRFVIGLMFLRLMVLIACMFDLNYLGLGDWL